ncbi:MAG TPA: PIN domain-containing protein [Leptolyngbyaceae cyanobacterium]
MEKSLLDTDILSEVRKNVNQQVASRATAYLAIFNYYTISVVTFTEIVAGWHKRQREDRIQQFFADMFDAEVLIMDAVTAEIAGRIYGDLERTGQPIGLADAIIAATALQHDLTLVSGNLAHYQRIQGLGYGLKLDNWRT